MELVKYVGSEDTKKQFIYQVMQFVHNGSGITAIIKPICKSDWTNIDPKRYYGYSANPNQYDYVAVYNINIIREEEIPKDFIRDRKLNLIGI